MRQVLILCGCVLLMLTAGCGDSNSVESAISSVNQNNMQRLINLYVRYQTQHRWQGPPSEDAFRDYIAQVQPVMLERMGVDPGNLDQLFVSERDNQPFQIRYGIPGSARGSNEAVIFEASGDQGKRQVGFTSSVIEEVADDQRYDGLWSGKISGQPVVQTPADPTQRGAKQ